MSSNLTIFSFRFKFYFQLLLLLLHFQKYFVEVKVLHVTGPARAPHLVPINEKLFYDVIVFARNESGRDIYFTCSVTRFFEILPLCKQLHGLYLAKF